MAVGKGKERLQATVDADEWAYIKENFRRIYSDATKPGEVISALVHVIVQADRDPQSYGRALDRIRFVQTRYNSKIHILGDAVLAELKNQGESEHGLAKSARLGFDSMLHCIQSLIRNHQAPMEPEPKEWEQFMEDVAWTRFKTAYAKGVPNDSDFENGARLAHASIRHFIRGATQMLNDPSVAIHHDFVSIDRDDAPLASSTCTVNDLRRIQGALSKQQGPMSTDDIERETKFQVSPSAIEQALAYFIGDGRVAIGSGKRVSWITQ